MVCFQPPVVERVGETWRVLSKYRDGRGTERRKTHILREARSRGEAVELAGEWYAALVRLEVGTGGGGTAPRADIFTGGPLIEVCMSWVDLQEERGLIEHTTAYTKRLHLKCLRERRLGAAHTSDVLPADIERWIDECIADGVGHSTILKALDCIRQVYKRLERDGLVERNPVKFIDKPKISKSREVNYIPLDALRELEERLEGYRGDAMPTAVRIALGTGMRIGEVCALKRSQVDFDRAIVTVNASMGRVAGSFERKTPKNGRVRRIPISKELEPVLRRACKGLRGGDFVLTASSDFYSPYALSKEWRAAVRCWDIEGSAGRAPTFHDLRHTFATYWVTAGGDIKGLQGILGHASAAMTLDIYAGASMGSMQMGMERMSAWMHEGGALRAGCPDGLGNNRELFSSPAVLAGLLELMDPKQLASHLASEATLQTDNVHTAL